MEFKEKRKRFQGKYFHYLTGSEDFYIHIIHVENKSNINLWCYAEGFFTNTTESYYRDSEWMISGGYLSFLYPVSKTEFEKEKRKVISNGT